ncbi:serine hydrolase domain-containing protein [Streptococcus oricebi]|uniref:Serine hydrolase n=1 Tax=Streptococcus oricebi TaxID=1547447 RepID=A0ABS5B4L0_9STRE|nr:serine hydrolase domain-containing protein [Streptococcus oricebi]MBP2623744.1 serine hydrolase [Streptococcus oricebi]
MSIDSILAKIEDQLANQIYPGASLALYRKGRWQEFYLGLSHPEQNLATRPGLIYDLASVSKVLGVGSLVILLIKKGELELDQSLKYYYPAFVHEETSLRQLLTHTSGLNPFIKNRSQLNQDQLRQALNQLELEEDKSFRYTDVNFLLLGFMLEEIYGEDLDQILEQEIFRNWQLKETCFGPVEGAVPTSRGGQSGMVHDPKAQVLGPHTGSAGLFSSLADLELFLDHYLKDDFAADLAQNYSLLAGKTRSLAWNLDQDWLDHTGYTGTFLMYNRKEEKAAIFLSNRTYEKDEREEWIVDRNQLMDLIKKEL